MFRIRMDATKNSKKPLLPAGEGWDEGIGINRLICIDSGLIYLHTTIALKPALLTAQQTIHPLKTFR